MPSIRSHFNVVISTSLAYSMATGHDDVAFLPVIAERAQQLVVNEGHLWFGLCCSCSPIWHRFGWLVLLVLDVPSELFIILDCGFQQLKIFFIPCSEGVPGFSQECHVVTTRHEFCFRSSQLGLVDHVFDPCWACNGKRRILAEPTDVICNILERLPNLPLKKTNKK